MLNICICIYKKPQAPNILIFLAWNSYNDNSKYVPGLNFFFFFFFRKSLIQI